jgi:hypothetical protein
MFAIIATNSQKVIGTIRAKIGFVVSCRAAGNDKRTWDLSQQVFTRHAARPNVRSKYLYNASQIAFGSLRVSAFSNPILTRASISVTCNSIHRERMPFRRRPRCKRMRSAAGLGRESSSFIRVDLANRHAGWSALTLFLRRHGASNIEIPLCRSMGQFRTHLCAKALIWRDTSTSCAPTKSANDFIYLYWYHH